MSSQARPVASKSHETLWLAGLVGMASVAIGGLALQLYKDLSRPPTAAPAAPPSRLIRASHADFFTGDLKRLQPHLDMTVGCVHVEYGLPDSFVSLEEQHWEDGQPRRSSGISGRLRDTSTDATISLTPVTSPEGKKPRCRITTALTNVNGFSAGTSTWDAPTTEGLQSYIKTLDKPIEIPDGPPVPVWAYILYKRKDHVFPPPELRDASFDEAARASVWAVVLKVRWKMPDDR